MGSEPSGQKGTLNPTPFQHGAPCPLPRKGEFFCTLFPAGHSTPSVKAYGFATFPKGTAFGGEGKDHGIAKGVPLGELARRKP